MSTGCDLWAPTPQLISNLNALNKDLPSDHFFWAIPRGFFSNVAKTHDLPTLSGSVPMGWPHVVDGIDQLWQEAVPARNTVTTAEEFPAINYALGYVHYPQGDLDLLWKKLIESMDHNHDGQKGKIGDARKKEDSEIVMMRGGEILRNMLRNIAERVQNTVTKDIPIVVFNGHGWQRDDPVKAHVTIYGGGVPGHISDYMKGMSLVDAAGKHVPFAIEKTSQSMSEALDLAFEATSVPSLGFKTYYLEPATQSQSFPLPSQVNLDNENEPRGPLGSDFLENRFYHVTADDATGTVTVFDKQLARNVCDGIKIEGQEERGANNIQPESNTGLTFPMAVHKTALEENNAVRTVLRIPGFVADIPVVQRLILYHSLTRPKKAGHKKHGEVDVGSTFHPD